MRMLLIVFLLIAAPRAWAQSPEEAYLTARAKTGAVLEETSKSADAFDTTKPGGHGLGLMIVQRIMRVHGGQVGVESREGKGTVVTLQFPRKDRRVRMLGGG